MKYIINLNSIELTQYFIKINNKKAKMSFLLFILNKYYIYIIRKFQ
jgi:hypothetical protein